MILYYTYYYKNNPDKMSAVPTFDFKAFIAKIDAQKAMHQKAKEASQGFGDASTAIYALNMMTGTSLCPFCNQHVMLSTKCRARMGEYHMDLIKQKDDEEEEEDED